MNESIKIDTNNSAIKTNPFKLIGAVITGIVVAILLFLGINILAHNLLGINVQASEIGEIGFIIFFLATVAISGYVSYRLTDEPNKIKIKGAIIGLLSGIIIFFVIFSFGLFLKTLLKIPYTDNNFNSQNIMFIGQIISAAISGFVSYRIGNATITSVIVAFLAAGLSFLILAMIAL